MLNSNRTTRTLRASVTTVLCAALLTTAAMAAPPTSQTVTVTPTAAAMSVGQKQAFTATGTFSNGSKQVLGPAIKNIAAGGGNTCVLLTSGGVECWGVNEVGQLGDGTFASSLVPRPVKGITNATAVTFGKHNPGFGCAVLAGGTAKCWGYNSHGQLGNGGVGYGDLYPFTVRRISSATAIAAGGEYTCALLAGGSVQCWGLNYYGQLGNGSNRNSFGPVSVTGISTASAVATENEHSCALLHSGAVQCWGSNFNGELGNGSTTSSNTPVTVIGINNATAVAAGGASVCALLVSGAVKCWGGNSLGQLGNGSNLDSSIPVSVTGISTAVAITAGTNHYCAVLGNGGTRCWGSNGSGELGNGTTTDSNIAVRVHEFNSPSRLMAAGVVHTCALLIDGMMRCWGNGDVGQLGDGRQDRSSLPVNVVGTPGVVWQSSDSTKATITDRGVATGRAVGNTTITATTAGFINDNAVLTVK